MFVECDQILVFALIDTCDLWVEGAIRLDMTRKTGSNRRRNRTPSLHPKRWQIFPSTKGRVNGSKCIRMKHSLDDLWVSANQLHAYVNICRKVCARRTKPFNRRRRCPKPIFSLTSKTRQENSMPADESKWERSERKGKLTPNRNRINNYFAANRWGDRSLGRSRRCHFVRVFPLASFLVGSFHDHFYYYLPESLAKLEAAHIHYHLPRYLFSLW